MVLYKKWLRLLKILLGATKQAIVLDADAYNPASGKHKDALEFVDPSNRPAYFVALQNSVRADEEAEHNIRRQYEPQLSRHSIRDHGEWESANILCRTHKVYSTIRKINTPLQ
jgi:hypothetical protein